MNSNSALCASRGLLALFLYAGGAPHVWAGDEGFHESTTWRIEPSFKYDALCLINALTGDPFYLWHYSNVYAEFAPKLTPEAQKALLEIKRQIKDDGKGIISAKLCLYFSAGDDESLDDLLATVRDPADLKSRFAETVYWSEAGWRQFEDVLDELAVVLRWYKQIGIETYWREVVEPVAAARAKLMLSKVSKYNIVPLIEAQLGQRLSSDVVTVYMLSYSKPHGIKITGTRFLTEVDWPFEIVVRNAVHEMMHPPYVLEGDDKLKEVIESLRRDAFLMDKVENHNPSFGYNQLEGFVEEDCVQAMEQLINERLGVAEDAKRRWAKSDDGMHVLAVALYQMMKSEGFGSSGESVRDFLVRMKEEGQFEPSRIKALHQQMYGS